MYNKLEMEVNYMIPKFRAWDKDNNQMCDVASIWFDRNDDQYKLGHITIPSQESVDVIFDNYGLMQSTGLKDKNGVEVFEGDIVKCTRGCPHEIIWLEEYGGTFIGGMPAWYLSGLKEGYAWTGEEEVIGNIYENTELLEVES